jgi:hypothetical protein
MLNDVSSKVYVKVVSIMVVSIMGCCSAPHNYCVEWIVVCAGHLASS